MWNYQARIAWRIWTAGIWSSLEFGIPRLGSHGELERPAWRIGYSQAGAIANNRIIDIGGMILDWVRIGPCLREGNWVRIGIC